MAKKINTQAQAILHFYKGLRPGFEMTDGISIMNPYENPATWTVAKQFYEKFYNDDEARIFIFGINPGRHGAGLTGVPFTDPIRLAEKCGIPNEWKKQGELSSLFIYAMIEKYGGVNAFYNKFYITALSPLGFVRAGKNLNYYDDKHLVRAFEPFMLQCVRQQLKTMPTADTCYCLGEGENFKYFSKVNKQHGFFKEIIPLPHPRWIMQYRRKKIEEFVDLYLKRFEAVG
jgi:hypothetical protein